MSTGLADTEKQIEALIGRIMDSGSATVTSAYEKRIEELERQKLRLSEQAGSSVPSHGRLEEFIEPPLRFLQALGYLSKG